MRTVERVKNILLFLRGKQAGSKLVPNADLEVQGDDDFHYTPPGQFPANGPKPSKLGVLFYYASLVSCIIGILFMGKCPYLPEESRPDALIMGSILISVGFLFLCITNFIHNRERRLIVEYLEGKIRELNEANPGKGPRPLDS